MRAATFLLAPRSAPYRFAISTVHGLPLPQTATHLRKQYKAHGKHVQNLPCCVVRSGASANGDIQGQAAALLEKQLRLLERERDESLQIANQCTARSKRLMARLDNLKDYRSQQERKQQQQAGAVRGASAGAQGPRARPASAIQRRDASPQGRDQLEAQTHKLVSSALNKNITRGRNNLDLAAKLEQYIGLLRAELERVRRGDLALAARVVAQAAAPKAGAAAAAESAPGTAASGGGTASQAAGQSRAGSGSAAAVKAAERGGAGPAARTSSSSSSSRPDPPSRQGSGAGPRTASAVAEGSVSQTRGPPLGFHGPTGPATPVEAASTSTGGPIASPSRTGGSRGDGPNLVGSSINGRIQPAASFSSPAPSPSTSSTSPSSASSNEAPSFLPGPSSNGDPARANGDEQAPPTAARSMQQGTSPQQPPEDGAQAAAGGLERIFARHPPPDAPPPPSLQAGLGPMGRSAGPSNDSEQPAAAATSAAMGDMSTTGPQLGSQAAGAASGGAETPSAPGVPRAREGEAGAQEAAKVQQKGEEGDQGQSGGQQEAGDGELDAAWRLAREWEDGRLALMGLLTPGNNLPGPLALLGPGTSSNSSSSSGDGVAGSAGVGGAGPVAAEAAGSDVGVGERSPGSGRPARPYALSDGAVPEGRVQVGSSTGGEVADARRLAALVRDMGQGLRQCGYVGCDEQVEVVLQAVAAAVAVSRRR